MRRWTCLLLVPLMAGCVPQSSLTPARIPLAIQNGSSMFPAAMVPPLNQDASASITFLNRTMLLPEGRWKVAATQAVSTKTGVLIGAFMALVRVDGPTLNGVLVLSGNAQPASNGFPVSVVCRATDVIWNDIPRALPQGDQDCASIGFVRPALWRTVPQSISAATMRQLDLLNVQPPNYMIALVIHESNRNWTLDEVFYQNPDIAGVPPDMSTQPALSAWAPFRVASDPARQRFVDELKQRAAPLRLSLRRQIEAHAPYIPRSGLTPA